MIQSDLLLNESEKLTLIDKIHPVIRVISFLLFSGFVSLADGSYLLTGASLLAGLYCLTHPVYLLSAFTMMRRMRWFFLSIIIIYAWMTPGRTIAIPVMSDHEAWLPTIEGIALGLMRVLSLALILMAVNLLLRCTSQQQFIMAIYWLAVPLSLFGISRERLSIRIALVFDVLHEVQKAVSDAFAEVRGTIKSLDQIGAFAAGVFHKVMQYAENTPNKTITLYEYNAPQGIQWLFPVAIWATFVSAGLLFGNL